MKKAKKKPAPRGRAAVTRALLDAAAALFSERGTAAVSVRDVAAQAGVNHGLVHRHFGSKQGLVRAVMADLTGRLATQAAALPPRPQMLPPLFAATAERSAYWRVLARALLDGVDPRELQESFPVVELLLARAREAQAGCAMRRDVDPRIIVAIAVALGLGWLVFEPFVLAATGLGEEGRERARDEAMRLFVVMTAPA